MGTRKVEAEAQSTINIARTVLVMAFPITVAVWVWYLIASSIAMIIPIGATFFGVFVIAGSLAYYHEGTQRYRALIREKEEDRMKMRFPDNEEVNKRALEASATHMEQNRQQCRAALIDGTDEIT